MRRLGIYKRVKVFFFGNEEEKKEFLREFIIPYFREKAKGNYFITKDWNGGPNIEVIVKGKHIEKFHIQEAVIAYCEENRYQYYIVHAGFKI